MLCAFEGDLERPSGPSYPGKNWAYLLGVYLGDGCVTLTRATSKLPHRHKPCFSMNATDLDFIEAVKAALEEYTDYSVSHYLLSTRPKENESLKFGLICRDHYLAGRLEMETECKSKIPKWVIESSAEDRLAFIAGLMDSEGSVYETSKGYTNRRFAMSFVNTDPWVEDFVKILNSVGISTGKIRTEIPKLANRKKAKRFTVNMQSWVDSGAYFNIARKQARVDEWNMSPAWAQAKYGRDVALSPEQLKEIAWSRQPSRALEERYGIAESTVWSIRSGKTRSSITGVTPETRLKRKKGNRKGRLSAGDVRFIRKSTEVYRQLAADFGVSAGTISLIKNGKTYKHVRD